jgi:hypothetical protein
LSRSGIELADGMGCNRLDEVTVCDYSEHLVLLIRDTNISVRISPETGTQDGGYAVLLLARMLYGPGWDKHT